jgi:hypothetical protein
MLNGCGGGELCAFNPVTRGEMAIVIARGIEFRNGSLTPDADVPTSGTDGGTRTYDCGAAPNGTPFPDVQAGSTFCKYVGFLWVNHIVDGFRTAPSVRTRRSGATGGQDPFQRLPTSALRAVAGSRPLVPVPTRVMAPLRRGPPWPRSSSGRSTPSWTSSRAANPARRSRPVDRTAVNGDAIGNFDE